MQTSQRSLALDVFRGMTVCFMIIVNTPGNGATTYAPLLHAQWHGFTPTDLVFPSFLFAVGNAMSFVMLKWENTKQSTVLWKIFKRTALIFLLGYLMYWFPFFKLDKDHHIVSFPIEDTRILGVLQRIALAYGIAALLIYYLKPKVATIVTCIILFLYWPVMIYYGDAQDPLSLLGNAGLRLDKWLMGDKHLYHGEGVPFDPEGWLSTLPAVGNVVGGFLVGRFIQQKSRTNELLVQGKSYEGLFKLLMAGCALMCVAYFWDFVFPINKKLWTSSFVLYTVGLDCVILSAVIFIIDFLGKKNWTYFFEVFGKNPLFIYLLSELLVVALYMINASPKISLHTWLYRNIFSRAGAYFGSLLFAVSYMLICWLVGYWLDKRKIYIRV